MVWQLLSRGAVLGTTGPELPSPAPTTTRVWPLVPAPAFDSIRPLVAAMTELQRSPLEPVPAAVREIVDGEERAHAIQAWIRTNPQTRRVVESYEQLHALGLQLVGEDGVPLAAWSIIIVELPLSDSPFVPEGPDDFVEVGFPAGPPFYTVVASLEEPEALRRARRADDDVSRPPT